MTSVHPISQTNSTNNLLQKKYILPTTSIIAASCGSYLIGEHIDKKNLEAEENRYHEVCNNHKNKIEEAFKKSEQADREYFLAKQEKEKLLLKYIDLKNKEFSKTTLDKYNLLMSCFPDLVFRWGEGNLTEIPNGIMFYGKDKTFADFLINWYGEETTNANGVFRTIGIEQPLMDALEAHCPTQPTNPLSGKRQLLHVKNFSNYINPQISSLETIDAAKAIMSASSEDHLTTILFYAEDINQLDSIAIESHRVSMFNIDDSSWDKEEFKNYINNKKEKSKIEQEMDIYTDKIKKKKKMAEQLTAEYQKISKEKIEQAKTIKLQKWKITAIGSAILPIIILINNLMKNNKKGKKND